MAHDDATGFRGVEAVEIWYGLEGTLEKDLHQRIAGANNLIGPNYWGVVPNLGRLSH